MARNVVVTEAPIRNKFGGDVALVQTSNTTLDDIPEKYWSDYICYIF